VVVDKDSNGKLRVLEMTPEQLEENMKTMNFDAAKSTH
jgi:hypothetical protein